VPLWTKANARLIHLHDASRTAPKDFDRGTAANTHGGQACNLSLVADKRGDHGFFAPFQVLDFDCRNQR
jgi:hypothetical protein